MKTFSINERELIAVPIDENAKNVQVSGLTPLLYYTTDDGLKAVKIPPGSWRILIPSTSEATEEQAASVVECKGFEAMIGFGGTHLYKNYTKDEHCWNTLESLSTLLEREGMKQGNFCVMEKK